MSKSSGLFLVFFAACMAPLNHPSVHAADTANLETEIRALTLQEAVGLTLAHSPQVLIAAAQSLRSREALRETRSLNRPQVTIGSGLAYNNGFPLSIEGAAPSIIQIGGSQSIFSKKNNNLIREAEESGKKSRFEIQSVRDELASRTASVYFELHQVRKIIGLESKRLDNAQRQQDIQETLLQAGKVRQVDVSLAKRSTAAARQQLLEAQERARVAEAELRELTGLSGSVTIQTAEPKIDKSVLILERETLYQHALECTPEVQQAESSVREKGFHLEAEKGENLPKLDIISQYALFSRTNNYQDFFNRFTRNNFLIGLSFQVPVFNGDRTGSRVAQSRQELAEARYRLQHIKSELDLRIQRELSALQVARGKVTQAQINMQTAKEVVGDSQARLEEGQISPKEMEESRSQLYESELAELEADLTVFQRELDLLRTTGSVESAVQ